MKVGRNSDLFTFVTNFVTNVWLTYPISSCRIYTYSRKVLGMSAIPNQSKSVLAKLLATENITMQKVAGAQTAWFDVKNRVLTLPIWQGISDDLEDMLVVHEVGHALDTPCDGWTNAIKDIATKIYGKASKQNQAAVKGFLNVIEDARIDKRQKRRYPGARRNYIVGYKELMDRDFFGTANKDINSYSFIDRVNIYFKGGVALGVQFSPEENAFVKRIDAAETFKEVVKITEEVFAYAKLRGEEDQKIQMEALRSGEGDEDEGEDFGDDFDTFEDDDEDSEGMAGEGDISASNDKDDSKDNGDGEDEQDESSNGAGSSDFIPESKTEKAWEQKQSELVANGTVKYQYVGVPKPIVSRIVDDYKLFLKENANYNTKRWGFNSDKDWFPTVRTEVAKFRTEENASISFMVKEFEMKKSADIFSRISIAKTGVLDTNKIHSYKYNEDVFRRQAIVPNGKNHGFVMILDWSGSMHGNLKDTIKQLIGLTSFCKRTQIPFEVYTFRDPTSTKNGPSFETAHGDLDFESFTMRNILSSRMNVSELNEAYALLWGMSTNGSQYEPMGGTPLNAAIVATEQIVNQFKARSKVQIVNVIFLTDGESNVVKGVRGIEIGHRWGSDTRYIIQDKVMKKDYYLTDHIYNCSREITINLLRILKDRTGCNLIGFYLHHASSSRVVHEFYGYSIDEKFRTTMMKQWNDNKFIPVTNHGYDDYYIINTQAMKDTENKLEINSSMTKSKIAKEFQKFSAKKAVNRVLLQRFIDKIATEKKKVA